MSDPDKRKEPEAENNAFAPSGSARLAMYADGTEDGKQTADEKGLVTFYVKHLPGTSSLTLRGSTRHQPFLSAPARFQIYVPNKEGKEELIHTFPFQFQPYNERVGGFDDDIQIPSAVVNAMEPLDAAQIKFVLRVNEHEDIQRIRDAHSQQIHDTLQHSPREK